MRVRSAARVIVLALLVIGAAGVASAQTQLGGVNVEGGIEAGGRFYLDSRPSTKERAKFEEYRDQNPGLFLLGANLRLSRPDESLFGEFGGSKWGFSDQDYYLSFGRLGTWQFDFLWDQTPHVLATTRTLQATQPHDGVFVLPTPRPSLPAHNSAPDLDEIAVRWDKAAMRFAYSVSPNLDFAVEYSRIRKEGDKPMGMAFGSPGANFYEVLQPIDQPSTIFGSAPRSRSRCFRSSSATACPSSRTISIASRRTIRASGTPRRAARARRPARELGRARFRRATWRTR